jgi:hypothetical protein
MDKDKGKRRKVTKNGRWDKRNIQSKKGLNLGGGKT